MGEHAVYVAPARARPQASACKLLDALAQASEQAGYYKLTSRVFTTNQASLSLHRAAGFTEVGIQRRHGRLDGEWKDTILVERLLGEAALTATTISSRCLPHHPRRQPGPAGPSRSRSSRAAAWRPTPCA